MDFHQLMETNFIGVSVEQRASIYQEEKNSTFTHAGSEYYLNPLLRKAAKTPIQRLALTELQWVLEHTTPDVERVAKADLTAPLLVVKWNKRWVAVDGLHRIAKAVRVGQTHLPAHVVPQSWLDKHVVR